MNKRTDNLLNNSLIFAISTFSSKFLSLLLMPLYTRVLSTAEYGAIDLLISTAALIVPLISLSMANTILRFSMDKDIDKRIAFSFGAFVITTGTMALVIAIPLIRKIATIGDYPVFLCLLVFLSAIHNYMEMFTRGIGKVKAVGIVGVVGTAVLIVCNILLLLLFRLGLVGYIYSMCIMHFVCTVALVFASKAWKYFTFRLFDRSVVVSMLKYGLPLVPNSASWWINNSMNKYLLQNYVGLENVGLFSAANKIPSIMVGVQNVIDQAWLLSAIDEKDSQEQNSFYSRCYNIYNTILVCSCTAIVALSPILGKVLFAKDFSSAWIYSPFLVLSVLFGGLSGFLGAIFSAYKKTTIMFVSTLLGAGASIFINILLIPAMGINGAAITSTFAYMIVWLVRFTYIRKVEPLKVEICKHLLEYSLMFVQCLSYSFFRNAAYIIQAVCIAIIFGVERKVIAKLIHTGLDYFKNLVRSFQKN